MINRLTEGYSAKCDKKDCGQMMTFEYVRSFKALIERMKEIGWRAFKRDDRWVNYCPKCIASSSEEKDLLENTSIVLTEAEADIIIKAKKFFAEMNIFLESRDVLNKILCDFEEKDLKAESHAPDLFSNKEEK